MILLMRSIVVGLLVGTTMGLQPKTCLNGTCAVCPEECDDIQLARMSQETVMSSSFDWVRDGCICLGCNGQVCERVENETARSALDTAAQATKDGLDTAAAKTKDGLEIAFNATKDGLATAKEKVPDALGTAFNATKDGLETAANATKNGLEKAAEKTKEGLNTAQEKVSDAFESVGNFFG